MEERNDIVIYKSEDGLVRMEALVDPANETIWASQKAIATLFDCTKQNVSYHMGKIFASGELERSTVVKEILTTAQSGARGLSEDKVLYYNLDAIISVGYRINSLRATKFRIWSTSIIKEYMRRGYVVNHNAVSEQKYEDLKKAVGLLENVFSKELLLTSDQATDLFDVIRDYTYALDTLDAYDYQSLKIADTTAPERFHATYDNAIEAIKSLKEKFGASELFGVEKDASFHSSIGQIYQTWDGRDLYPSIEEKAAMLLYLSGQEPLLRGREQTNRSHSFPLVYAKQRHSLPCRRNKAHLRCFPCGADADDCGEPHGRDGHDGQGRR